MNLHRFRRSQLSQIGQDLFVVFVSKLSGERKQSQELIEIQTTDKESEKGKQEAVSYWRSVRVGLILIASTRARQPFELILLSAILRERRIREAGGLGAT
jgi:hypothetical protein